MSPSDAERYHYADFTEDRYREMLAMAKRRYRFEPFGTEEEAPHILWRHDVDFSVHRALRLAEIEAEEGVRATYFLFLHSELYNLLEADVFTVAMRILELGHWLGLHFDPQFYARDDAGGDVEPSIERERRLLEELTGTPVGALSFHNPGVGGLEVPDADRLAGIVNAYGRGIRERYSYVSDSNGYWRHRRLPEVLEAAEEERLHVLTHPEWWQPEPMPPRERVERCIEGRARAAGRWYDELLERMGRENVG